MGLFDLFKNKEERERERIINQIRDQIFPGGNDQFLNEVREIRELLNFKYSQDEILKTYSHAVGVFHVSTERSEKDIVTSILHNKDSVVTKDDATKIFWYLKERYNDEEIKRSFFVLAQMFNCLPTEVTDYYLNSLQKQNFSEEEIDQAILHWHKKRVEEAEAFKMSIENTPAALMEQWTKAYKAKRYPPRQETDNSLEMEF